jgi:hypothetical protein
VQSVFFFKKNALCILVQLQADNIFDVPRIYLIMMMFATAAPELMSAWNAGL